MGVKAKAAWLFALVWPDVVSNLLPLGFLRALTTIGERTITMSNYNAF
jgi:hypothetical protein